MRRWEKVGKGQREVIIKGLQGGQGGQIPQLGGQGANQLHLAHDSERKRNIDEPAEKVAKKESMKRPFLQEGDLVGSIAQDIPIGVGEITKAQIGVPCQAPPAA